MEHSLYVVSGRTTNIIVDRIARPIASPVPNFFLSSSSSALASLENLIYTYPEMSKAITHRIIPKIVTILVLLSYREYANYFIERYYSMNI